MKLQKVLLVSCAVILVCTFVITGMTYALFTDQVSVESHLKAGNLDVTLTRTALEYSTLNTDGELVETRVNEPLVLNGTVRDNVFGIDSADVRIVPGSYFDATLEITNDGNTAFDYTVTVKQLRESNALAEQLQVTVTHADGTQTVRMLSTLSEGLTVEAGRMQVGEIVQRFSVRVDFIDDTNVNNDAQELTAAFDLIVEAVQSTASR